MAFLLGAIGLTSTVGNLFKGLERGFNSSEHNFKSDLDGMLRQTGMPDALRQKIRRFLNTGRDQEIGGKLNALMYAGIIPQQYAGEIAELASRNRVPRSSFDPSRICEPMTMEECRATIGGPFAVELEEVESLAEATGMEALLQETEQEGADDETGENDEDEDREG